jgi:hypothetical protein
VREAVVVSDCDSDEGSNKEKAESLERERRDVIRTESPAKARNGLQDIAIVDNNIGVAYSTG